MPMVGRWRYGSKQTEYCISTSGDELLFDGPHSRVGRVTGSLKRLTSWLQADLKAPDGEHVGFIRLRFAEEAGTMVSNFRSLNKKEWGKDIIAYRYDDDCVAPGSLGSTIEAAAVPEAPVGITQVHEQDPYAPIQDDERIGIRTGKLWLLLLPEEI